jgi:hypothetical protein
MGAADCARAKGAERMTTRATRSVFWSTDFS